MPFFYPKKPSIAVSLTILMWLSGCCGIVEKLDEMNENRDLIRKRGHGEACEAIPVFGTPNYSELTNLYFHRDYISLLERSLIFVCIGSHRPNPVIHQKRYFSKKIAPQRRIHFSF